MTLSDGFGPVSADYDRGRASYPPEAVAMMLGGLPRPAQVVDVGAGTGQLTAPLLAAGAHVTAVEPLATTRGLLAQRVGDAAEVVDGRAEALPLATSSVDLVTCGDAFHWFDRDAALTEFRRVLRTGGRLSISALRWAFTDEQTRGWGDAVGSLLAPLWARSSHPLRETPPPGEPLPAGHGFAAAEVVEVPFAHATDRDGIAALFMSLSVVGVLPDDERATFRTQLHEALAPYALDDVALSFVATLHLSEAV
jgi:SAM-dependent methyltransferase